MNTTYEWLRQKANGHAQHLEYSKRFLSADLPEAGFYWENLATTRYVPCKDWEAAACACELAGDAWKRLEQRGSAAQNYGQAAVYYASAGRGSKAREMNAMANDVQHTLYL